MFIFVCFLLIILLLCSVPLYMIKNEIPMTGRDLFFAFVGMTAMGVFSLIAVMT